MRIAIIGAGSMGSMFGGLLAASGNNVTLVDPNLAHMQAVARDGLVMRHKAEQRHVQLAAQSVASGPAVDLIVFLTKAFDTAPAARAARVLCGPGTIALSLQNGLGNAEAMADGLGTRRILAGVTAIGAALTAPGVIELTASAWTGGGGTWIGAWEAGVPRGEIDRIAAAFTGAGILTHVVDDVAAMIWNKLAMASGMAAITALARLKIDAVLASSDGVALLDEVIAEIVMVARAKGIALDGAAARESAFATFHAAGSHVTSMAADVVARRRTEIDALNGGVVREAERLGLDAPVNRTIAQLVRLVEGAYDKRL